MAAVGADREPNIRAAADACTGGEVSEASGPKILTMRNSPATQTGTRTTQSKRDNSRDPSDKAAERARYLRPQASRLCILSFLFVIAGLGATTASLDTAAAASRGSHFSTMYPHSALPSTQECAARIPPSPETIPANIPFNHTMPSPAQLAAFYAHPVFGSNPPASDFFRVDGHYTGSTDMILRWAACKWGIDEDVMRAQAWTESKWRQGGPTPGDGGGDKRMARSQCVQGSFSALWNYGCANCCYQSWGILQTKVYYEWGTWPMIKDSTAFNADYRFADQRACMNGDYAGYFASAAQQPNTYSADIASGNIDRVLWGCIGMHYSGGWYTPPTQRYIAETKGYLTRKPWLALSK